MRRYEFAASATHDLADIHGHILQQDAMTASLIIDRIQETVENLCAFPQIGKRDERRDIWVFGGSPKNPFRIVYRFDDKRIRVVRIFRSSRTTVHY